MKNFLAQLDMMRHQTVTLLNELQNNKFQVKKKQFFRNFMTIILFGAVGTLISFAVISLGAMHLFQTLDLGSLEIGDYLAIGAIFSTTDSVCTLQVLNQDETPLMYNLVFGEGVVNDATSVVLLKALQNFDLCHHLRIISQFFILTHCKHYAGNFGVTLEGWVMEIPMTC